MSEKVAWKQRWASKATNLKFVQSWAYSAITNPPIPRCASPQIANSHISTKYCTTLSQNSPKSRLFKTIFYIMCNFLCAIWEEKKYVFVDFFGLLIANPKIINPQITKIGSASSKFAKFHICERHANLTEYLNLKILGFAVCGTYLRSADLCCRVSAPRHCSLSLDSCFDQYIK